MLFMHPAWLWLLLLILPLVGVHLTPRFGLRGIRGVMVIGLRVMVLVLLVLALARPVIERGTPAQTTVAVVDVSGSMDDDGLGRVQSALEELNRSRLPGERLRLITFDARAREIPLVGRRLPALVDRPQGRVPATAVPTTRPSGGSALADALQLAGAVLPASVPGRVILYTDGLQTGGDALAAAEDLAARHIPLKVVPLGSTRTREVILKSISLPSVAAIGAAVTLRAHVEADQPAPAKLIVRRTADGTESRFEVTLRKGLQELTAVLHLDRQGIVEYLVRIESPHDTLGDNNVLTAALHVLPPRTVEVIENHPQTPATAALRMVLGASAQVRSVTAAAYASRAGAPGPDLLVAADTSAEEIDEPTQQRIRDAVRGGQSLFVTGGRRSFGPGGYGEGPLAEVLPVRFSQDIERRDPSTTLVVIIDTSGSMTGTRVSLAKEVARLALARLAPHDKAGIVEFYGSKRWAAPIQSASNAIDLQRALNRLSAGGGTVILPAIEESYYALQNVRTRTKHVLVLTDGGVESGAFEPLIRRMADHGITLSTVLVGPGGQSAFLATLAQWGRGRFYAAPDRFNLPEIIVKQPDNSMMAPFVEQPSRLVKGLDDPVLADLELAGAPALAGYVETQLRPTADLLLASDLGHPVLARWRFGLGRVATFTTQLGGEWTAELSQWPAYGRLLANVVRQLYAPSPTSSLRMEAIERPGAVELKIDNLLPDPAERFAALDFTLRGPAGAALHHRLDPVLPDAWNVRLEGLAAGTYELEARTADGLRSGSAGLAVQPVREIAALGPDAALLEALAAAQPLALRVSRAVEPPAARAVELSPLLTGLALALVPLHVLLRRWPARLPRTVAVAAAVVLLAVMQPGTAAAQTAPGGLRRLTISPRTAGRVAPAAASRPADSSPAGPAAGAEPARRQALSPSEISLLDACIAEPDTVASDTLFLELCGRVTEQDGRLDLLLRDLRQRAGASPRAARLLARTARASGNLLLARQTLTDLASGPHADAGLLGELAQLHELAGDDNAALSAIDRALSGQPSAEAAFALRIRKALLLYAMGDSAAAGPLLGALAAESGDNDVRRFCGHLASLHHDYAFALELLTGSGHSATDFQEHLFRGLFLLRLDRPADAAVEFEQAYREAAMARDRRFALERIITAARQAGTLKDLADAWMADPRLPADRMAALVPVLRELDRMDDVFVLFDRPATTLAHRQLVESQEFQREAIAAALSAGRSDRAESVYLKLLKSNPDQIEWLASLARIRLLEGRREDARQVLDEAAGRFNDPARLMTLADAARKLSLDDVALAAVHKAAASGVTYKVRAVLFEADLARQHGDADAALDLVHQAIPLAQQDARALQLVSEALEKHGDKAESLRLARQIHEQTRTEDTLLRLAWLLEENKQIEEALSLWTSLWRTTQVPARLKQAQERVLDLASRNGRLADLAVQIEERLDQNQGSDRDLETLLEIYTTANDPVSAAEILQDLAGRTGNEVEMLRRLPRVYLSCEQFGRCNATLRKLARLDPENAAEYVQQIAIVALERRQPNEAKAALAELAALAPGDQTVDEFSAGVLEMAGDHLAAADAYNRVLVRHPDRIESLLLWGNAMKAAGRTDAAIARFQNLVEEADEDDLFTVAVDGLLNLQARPAVLESALRRVYTRIAADPTKVFLYQLGTDLLEAANRQEDVTDLLEQSVVIAGERRGALLRELMDRAKADNRHEAMMFFGRSLLALGEEAPPQVFLDLGEAMLKQGEPGLAERVFGRASVEGDYIRTQESVAEYYENAGLPADADRIIRELLIGEPDNVALLIRSGSLSEQLGVYERAFEQYYRASDLILRRLPGANRAADSQPSPSPAGGGLLRRSFMAANVSDSAKFFESAGDGLLNAARSDALRDRLRRDLLKRVEEELGRLESNGGFAPALADNPRLSALAKFFRQAAFAIHEPDDADRLDRRLLERYPGDETLRAGVVRDRVDYGLYERAAAFTSGDEDPAKLPAELAVEVYLASPQRLDEALSKGQVNPTLAARLAPILIMIDRPEAARRVISTAPTAPVAELGEAAASLIAAAIVLNDAAGMARWQEYWLDACQNARKELTAARPAVNPALGLNFALFRTTAARRKGPVIAQNVQRCIACVWNHLDDDGRAALIPRLARVAGALDEGDRAPVELLRLQLCEALGRPFEGLEELARSAAKDAEHPVGTLMPLLEKSAAPQRPELIRAMIEARPPAARRSFILGFSGELSFEPDDACLDVCMSAFREAPKAAVTAGQGYLDAYRGTWNRNRRHPELGLQLGELLLSEYPNDPCTLVGVALSRDAAGRRDEVFWFLRVALDQLSNLKNPVYIHKDLVETCARLLGPDERRAILGELETLPPTAMTRLLEGVLLEAADEPEAAIEAFRAAYELSPTNLICSRKVITELTEAGRIVELTRLLSTHLTQSTVMQYYERQTLTSALFSLYRPADARATSHSNQSILAPVDAMRAAKLFGQADEVRTIFRRFMTTSRNDGRFYTPYWPAEMPSGGLGSVIREDRYPWVRRIRLFDALADLPFAQEDYLGLLMAAGPSRRDVSSLVSGLRRAAAHQGTQRRILDSLADAQRRDAFNFKDRAMLVALAEDAPRELPEPLPAVLDSVLLHASPTDVATLQSLVRICMSNGREAQAQRIMDWLIARSVLPARAATYSYLGTESNEVPLETLVELWPADQREPLRHRLFAALEPSPLDAPDKEIESRRVDYLIAAGDHASLQSRADLLRERLAGGEMQAAVRDLRTIVARADAACGRHEQFAEQVAAVLDALAVEEPGQDPFDAGSLLPAGARMADTGRCVDAVVAALLRCRDSGRLSRATVTRQLALLARWCLENGQPDRAQGLLVQAAAEAGGLGEHWLWVADAARLMCEYERAAEIELRLLDAEMLPIARVPGLLDQIEASQGRGAADAIAVRVADYTDHPAVLQRALRAAAAAGDGPAAGALRTRLNGLFPLQQTLTSVE